MGALKTWSRVALGAGAISAAWAGAWFLIAQHADRTIDEWIADENTRGRQWACANRTIAGFPFNLETNCASPTFKSEVEPIRSATARRLLASANVLSPFQIAFRMEGPAVVVTTSGASTLGWESLTGSARPGSEGPDLALRIKALRVEEASGDASAWAGSAAQDSGARIQKSPDRAPGSSARELTLNVEGLKAPPLDAFFENDAPVRASLTAIVLDARIAASGPMAQRVDAWAAAGGRIQISSLLAEKGESRLDASGELSLDERRRPVGRLSVRLEGVQPILSRLNLPAAPLAIEGLLRGGGRNASSSLFENRVLPLEFRAGRLYLGPVRTPVVIPPLF